MHFGVFDGGGEVVVLFDLAEKGEGGDSSLLELVLFHL